MIKLKNKTSNEVIRISRPEFYEKFSKTLKGAVNKFEKERLDNKEIENEDARCWFKCKAIRDFFQEIYNFSKYSGSEWEIQNETESIVEMHRMGGEVLENYVAGTFK